MITGDTYKNLPEQEIGKHMTVQDKEHTQKNHTDNAHDKGYKRIFSIKKNFLDFIKKYILKSRYIIHRFAQNQGLLRT